MDLVTLRLNCRMFRSQLTLAADRCFIASGDFFAPAKTARYVSIANLAAAMLARNSASASGLMPSSCCFSDKTVAIPCAKANNSAVSFGNGLAFISFLPFVGARFNSGPYSLKGAEMVSGQISLAFCGWKSRLKQ